MQVAQLHNLLTHLSVRPPSLSASVSLLSEWCKAVSESSLGLGCNSAQHCLISRWVSGSLCMPRKLGWNWGWQWCITVNKALKHFQKRLRQLSLLDGAKNTAWHCNVSYRNINNNVNISTIEKHSVVINLLLHFCACSNKISLLVFYRTKHVQWIHTCLTGPHFVIAPRCFSLIWQPWCNFFSEVCWNTRQYCFVSTIKRKFSTHVSPTADF